MDSQRSNTYDIRFISKRWEHHSSHSGYDQLVERLGSAIPRLNLDSLREKIIPGRVGVWLARKSGNYHYSYIAFYHEWSAIREMAFCTSPRIYHFLYADDSYRYMGSLGKRKNARIIATYHLPPLALKEYIKSTGFLKKLDGVIVVAKNQIPFFAPIIGADKIFFVPLGVDTNVFIPDPELNKKNLPQKLCLFVGLHRRDFETLRKVIELLNQHTYDIRFVIVSEKEKKDFFGGLKNVDFKHGITEIELIQLYQKADLLLQPLLDSTANTAILEALSCGLPVVASDLGGARDYLDESCGVFVPPNDPEAMAQNVVKMLGDQELLSKKATNARAHALEYDWSVIVEKVSRVYQQTWINPDHQ